MHSQATYREKCEIQRKKTHFQFRSEIPNMLLIKSEEKTLKTKVKSVKLQIQNSEDIITMLKYGIFAI